MPSASSNKYAEKRLVYINTKIVNIPSSGEGASAGTPIKYGFWTNVDNSQDANLGHTVIEPGQYFTPQQGLVLGASYPKPSRASPRFSARQNLYLLFGRKN